jgi:hypothetical protein
METLNGQENYVRWYRDLKLIASNKSFSGT